MAISGGPIGSYGGPEEIRGPGEAARAGEADAPTAQAAPGLVERPRLFASAGVAAAARLAQVVAASEGLAGVESNAFIRELAGSVGEAPVSADTGALSELSWDAVPAELRQAAEAVASRIEDRKTERVDNAFVSGIPLAIHRDDALIGYMLPIEFDIAAGGFMGGGADVWLNPAGEVLVEKEWVDWSG